MKTWIRETYQNFRAWRRGERRVAPAGARGRVYAPKKNEGSLPSAAKTIKTKTTYRTLARVIRADGRPDEHYDLTEGRKLSADNFETLRGDTTHG